MPLRTKSFGLTLIELLVTMVLAATVAMFAVPSFEQMILDNRLVSQVKELSSLISFARSEAAKRSNAAFVTMCPTTDNATCSGVADWGDGWMILLDWNGDRTLNTGAGGEADQLLRVVSELSGGNSLSVTGFSSTQFVQFSGNGQPTAAGTLGANPGTFVVCDDRGDNFARGIVVMVSGQMRMALDSADVDVIVEGDGGNVSCS